MIFNDREIKPYKIIETPQEVANRTGKEPKVLVTDFDDTLALSTSRQIRLILDSKNIETYSKYLDLRQFSDRFLLDRTEYYTCNWLKRKDVEKVPEEIIHEVTDFFNVPNFYDDVKPTKFATALKSYLMQDYCDKIYIVSHCLSETAIMKAAQLLRASIR